ncbi:putative diguanylate cyclase AdrA [compost metagenome]
MLTQLSSELKRGLREDDLAGRYGGDEFCLILPNSDVEQARQTMERLRERIGSYRNPQLPALRISLSIGLASCREDLTDAEAWLNEADKALYVAKNSGRNQVNFSQPDLTTLKLAYPQ